MTAAGKHHKPKLRRYKKPKPTPPPKPVRPKRGDLRKIYKDYISIDQDQRITALAKAMAWYDTVQVYIKYKQGWKFTTKQLRYKNIAEKDRELGIKSVKSDVKEAKFFDSVIHYEIMCEVYKPPKLKAYDKKLHKVSKELQASQVRMKDKYQRFLKVIQDSLAPSNVKDKTVKLEINKLSTPYRISSEGNVTFDRKLIASQRKLARKKGIFSVVINLLPILSEVRARVPEIDQHERPTGRVKISHRLRYQAVLELLNKFNQYCQTPEGPHTVIRRMKPKED